MSDAICVDIVSTGHEWSSLNLSEGTRKAIQEMGFERMTEVQSRCIPVLLVRDLY